MHEEAEVEPSESLRVINDWPTKAIILAAGRGRRLQPITQTIPKPLLKVGGRPLLDWTLESLQIARTASTCIVVNHLADQIVRYVERHPTRGMDIEFCYQKEPLGTADALLSAAHFFDQPAFIVAADYALSKEQLLELKREYQLGSADMVISLKEVPAEELQSRSLVQISEDGLISRLIEKPHDVPKEEALGASLIYIVPPETIKFVPEVPLSLRGEYELPQVIDLMIQTGWVAKGILQTAPMEWSGIDDGNK